MECVFTESWRGSSATFPRITFQEELDAAQKGKGNQYPRVK